MRKGSGFVRIDISCYCHMPPELIDHIFSFLRGEDTSALKACSEAHPLYSMLAERHLYANICADHHEHPDLHDQLSDNPHFLNYARSLQIYGGFECSLLSIMAMIPRMANLVALTICSLPCPPDQFEEFISVFTTCLQQSSIQLLDLCAVRDFPLSVLNNGKYIKKLKLVECIVKDEPILSSSSSGQSLETLILSGTYDPRLYLWAEHQASHLISLGLSATNSKERGFPGLLMACSKSLTTLHFDIDHDCSNLYSYDIAVQAGSWMDIGNRELPFTLSSLNLLKNILISAPIDVTETNIKCAVPEIVRLIKTAPAIEYVVLNSCCHVSGSITSLGQLDWSLLNCLESDLTGTRPRRIDVHIIAYDRGPRRWCSPESVLNALGKNEILMDLVERGLVVLKSESAWALWDGICVL